MSQAGFSRAQQAEASRRFSQEAAGGFVADTSALAAYFGSLRAPSAPSASTPLLFPASEEFLTNPPFAQNLHLAQHPTLSSGIPARLNRLVTFWKTIIERTGIKMLFAVSGDGQSAVDVPLDQFETGFDWRADLEDEYDDLKHGFLAMLAETLGLKVQWIHQNGEKNPRGLTGRQLQEDELVSITETIRQWNGFVSSLRRCVTVGETATNSDLAFFNACLAQDDGKLETYTAMALQGRVRLYLYEAREGIGRNIPSSTLPPLVFTLYTSSPSCPRREFEIPLLSQQERLYPPRHRAECYFFEHESETYRNAIQQIPLCMPCDILV